MGNTWRKLGRVARAAVLAAGTVTAVGSAVWLAGPPPAVAAPTPPAAPAADKVARLGKDRLVVPEAVAARLGLKTAAVAAPSHALPLPPLPGVLNVDSVRMARVHPRFAGEVVSVGTRTDPAEPTYSSQSAAAEPRPLRPGDEVKKGELLAVVWSKDLGEKKSELVDAVSKLRTDEGTLRRLEAAYRDGGTPERSVREAERAVQSDRVAVERAERTLRSWRLTDAEVAAVRAEADRLNTPAAPRAADPADWARVEVRSPQDGVVLEMNVTVGAIVDTTAELFKVGDLSHLLVWAHLYEDDLPLLQALPKPIRWTVTLPARPGVSFPGRLEAVGAVIDPNQHTALVTGRVDNPRGELKVGQFVTVHLDRPAPTGEVVLPTEAVVEDGRESVVFVRPDANKAEYVRRTVTVARRTKDEIYLPDSAGLHPGDRVVTAGALLLRDAMDQLPVPAE